jgi:hypothetical protein
MGVGQLSLSNESRGWRRARGLAVLVALLLAVPSIPTALALQSATWLDQGNPTMWNVPGVAVPTAPPPTHEVDPRILERNRAPETAEDGLVAGEGWHLIAPYEGGWGVKIVTGASDYDGMGRPMRYQAFVFVDGFYAGTLSPELMDSRTDGALTISRLLDGSTIIAAFSRYAPTDPLCCPSAVTSVQYSIDREGLAPVVVPGQASTQPTSTGAE